MAFDAVRAWKDPDYRATLNEAERSLMSENPAGTLELNEVELSGVNGALEAFLSLTIVGGPCTTTVVVTTPIICGDPTSND